MHRRISDVQVFTTTHNTDLMSNDLLRPDCYFLLENNSINAISELTEKPDEFLLTTGIEYGNSRLLFIT